MINSLCYHNKIRFLFTSQSIAILSLYLKSNMSTWISMSILEIPNSFAKIFHLVMKLLKLVILIWAHFVASKLILTSWYWHLSRITELFNNATLPQCGNLMIFLLLRFYVKSYDVFEKPKLEKYFVKPIYNG